MQGVYNDLNAFQGIDEFSHLWLIWQFHDNKNQQDSAKFRPQVRPPRLGGKQKMGVFATRSPHRPNHLGLSLLKLERIDTHKGIQLWCSGADLLDGTPVIDIKPYIPFVEAKPDAASGFVNGAPELLTVTWQDSKSAADLSPQLIALIEQSIAQDPRPAYQDIPERVYVMNIADYEIRFQIQNKHATILALTPVLKTL